MKFSIQRLPVFFLAAAFYFSSCSGSGQSSTDTIPDPAESQRLAREQADADQKAAAERQQQQLAAYRSAVTNLLNEDAATVPSAGGNYTAVAAMMRKFDLSQCPRDFATAYVDHIHAWEDAAEIQGAQQQLKNSADGLLAKALLQKLFGSEENALQDAAEIEQKLNEAQDRASEAIKNTFNEVEHIATSYGATLPQKK